MSDSTLTHKFDLTNTEQSKALLYENPDAFMTELKRSPALLTKGMVLQEMDVICHQIQKAKDNGQLDMITKLLFYLAVKKHEHTLVREGYTKYVMLDTVLTSLKNFPDCEVKLIYVRNYQREIPDHISEKLRYCRAHKLFDEYAILYTDYSGKQNSSAKELTTANASNQPRQRSISRDPILFGLYRGHVQVYNSDVGPKNIHNISHLYGRAYFIGDWVDEHCELTLDSWLGVISEQGKYTKEVIDLYDAKQAPFSEKGLLKQVDELMEEMKVHLQDLQQEHTHEE